MKRIAILIAVAALTACGGSSNGGSNTKGSDTAKNTTFTYGDPATAGSSELSTASGAISDVVALRSGGATMASGDPSSITGALLGDSGLGINLPINASKAALQRTAQALDVVGSSYGFADDSCVAQATNDVKFSNCTMHIDEGADGVYDVTVNGEYKYATDTSTLTWTLSVNVKGHDSYGSSGDITLARDGNLQVTDVLVKGDFGQSLSGSLTHSGTTYNFNVGESVLVDVTIAECGVSAGTLEAKRVWVTKPSGPDIDQSQLQNKAAKITWTGCGTATVQYSK